MTTEFIKKCTKALIETQRCFITAEKTKLQNFFKNEKDLKTIDYKFYYNQMAQITTSLLDIEKQLELLEKKENETSF